MIISGHGVKCMKSIYTAFAVCLRILLDKKSGVLYLCYMAWPWVSSPPSLETVRGPYTPP